MWQVQFKILDQRRGQLRVAEGDAAHHHVAAELSVFRFLVYGGLVGNIDGVLHHVLDALHIGAHLHESLARADEGFRRGGEGAEEALKRQNHTHGELPLHRKPDTQHQHSGAGKLRHRGGDEAEILVQLLKPDVLGVDAGLIARPFLKITVFRAGGFQRFDHLDAGDGGGGQLAAVAHHDAGEINPLFRHHARDKEIDDDARQSYQRQNHAVAQHDHKIEDHHDRIQRQRREGVHHRRGDAGVGRHALLNIPGHALGVKLQRQAQDFPHILRVAHHGDLTVDAQGVDRVHPCHNDLNGRHAQHSQREGQQPCRILPGQQLIHKDAGEAGIDNPHQ